MVRHRVRALRARDTAHETIPKRFTLAQCVCSASLCRGCALRLDTRVRRHRLRARCRGIRGWRWRERCCAGACGCARKHALPAAPAAGAQLRLEGGALRRQPLPLARLGRAPSLSRLASRRLSRRLRGSCPPRRTRARTALARCATCCARRALRHCAWRQLLPLPGAFAAAVAHHRRALLQEVGARLAEGARPCNAPAAPGVRRRLQHAPYPGANLLARSRGGRLGASGGGLASAAAGAHQALRVATRAERRGRGGAAAAAGEGFARAPCAAGLPAPRTARRLRHACS